MFLSVLKVVIMIFFVYGVYSSILLVFELLDSRRYKSCVYVDADKVNNIEDAMYTILMRHPNTEVQIVESPDTDSEKSTVISKLCERYDFVYSISEE